MIEREGGERSGRGWRVVGGVRFVLCGVGGDVGVGSFGWKGGGGIGREGGGSFLI